MTAIEAQLQQGATFSFGKNWQNFLKSLDEERIRNAEASLTEFIPGEELQGKQFIDIGCGSGLFSYAAHKLGAERIVSLDVDPFSVECCKHMRERAGNPQNWQIHEGSILDDEFVSRLGSFDVVYSWGVLHHTGNMWKAIRNSARMVREGGLYYIAIYNRVGGLRGSDNWLKLKRLYNRSPKAAKYSLEQVVTLGYFTADLVRLKNPIATIRNYKANRGMEWKTDIRDWLGGYPYEYATIDEIFSFIKGEFKDFNLEKIKSTNGLGTNWFLFRRQPATALK